MNILTEEELKEIENVYSLSFKEVAENYPTIVKLITSHRAIQERNRNLVSENDELNKGKYTDAQEEAFSDFIFSLPLTMRQTAINAISIFGIIIEGVNDHD